MKILYVQLKFNEINKQFNLLLNKYLNIRIFIAIYAFYYFKKTTILLIKSYIYQLNLLIQV
jgi:hypothetical protein